LSRLINMSRRFDMLKAILATLILCAAAVRAEADMIFKDIEIYGWGTQSCKVWTAHSKRGDPVYFQRINWVFGFITAAGHYSTLRKTDLAEVTLWIDNYCHAHPLTNVANAAGAFTGVLGGD
jgi:hypothetical protein